MFTLNEVVSLNQHASCMSSKYVYALRAPMRQDEYARQQTISITSIFCQKEESNSERIQMHLIRCQ